MDQYASLFAQVVLAGWDIESAKNSELSTRLNEFEKRLQDYESQVPEILQQDARDEIEKFKIIYKEKRKLCSPQV